MRGLRRGGPRTRREFESRACKGTDHANSEAPLPVVNVDGYPSGSGCTAGGRLGRVRGGAHQSGQHQVGDAPPSLPKGAKVAVLYGDPSKAGPFCMRLMAPAGYKIPPHWHSQAEALTVISGTFYLGMGDKMDATAAQPLKAGGFHYLPPKEHHFAFSKAASVVQLNGEGPFDITYINAADDPQKATKR